ncbi:hypothetical protein HYT32_01690 [Candidatus Roizmanbacteria bacterium]|nr:hypothetical protein [Candidatus Roizmanbacteria bacterium]
MRGINLFILVIIVLIIVATSGFLLWTNNTKPQETNIPNQQSTEEDNTKKTVSLCSEYQPVDGEISCEEAMDLALNSHSGLVTEIRMANNFRTANQQASGKGINAWRITISLSTPLEEDGEIKNNVRITLERTTGKEISKYYSK